MTALLSFIPALFFYAFPAFVGRGFFKKFSKNTLSYPWITYFIIGSLIFYAFLVISAYLFPLLIPGLSFISIVLAVIAVLGFVATILNFPFSRITWDKNWTIPTIIAALTACIIYALWQFKSPYSFNWDMYEHQTLVNTILGGKFSYITSRITDTFVFNGYSSMFHSLIALSQIIYAAPLVGFWHSISIVHFALIILASYFFVKEVTENTTMAILAGILSALTFDSTVSFSSLFFVPQTFTACIFAFLLTQLITQSKRDSLPSLPFILTMCLFLFINHYIIGSVALVIYLATYFYLRNPSTLVERIYTKGFMFVMFICAFGALLLSSKIPLGFINAGEAAAFTETLTKKVFIMRQVYGYILLFFLPIGIYAIIKRKNQIELWTLLMGVGLMILVLLQLPYVLKFYVLARLFVHLIIAIGIYAFLSRISSRILRSISVGMLIVTLLTIFITNASYWKSSLNYDDILTHVSPHELEAADFLKNHYTDTDALLVSDPATQYVLETFSGVNTQGGTYMNTLTREELIAISQAQSGQEVATRLARIEDSVLPSSGKRIFALSGRYFVWQTATEQDKKSLSFNIWYPSDLTFDNLRYIRHLADSGSFSLVYQNPTVVIFEAVR